MCLVVLGDCAPLPAGDGRKKARDRRGLLRLGWPLRVQRTDCMKRSKPASATLNQAFCDFRYFSNSV